MTLVIHTYSFLQSIVTLWSSGGYWWEKVIHVHNCLVAKPDFQCKDVQVWLQKWSFTSLAFTSFLAEIKMQFQRTNCDIHISLECVTNQSGTDYMTVLNYCFILLNQPICQSLGRWILKGFWYFKFLSRLRRLTQNFY